MLGIQEPKPTMVSGVKALPSINPNMGMTKDLTFGAVFSRTPDKLAIVVTTIAPIIHANGICIRSKAKPPAAPKNRVPTIAGKSLRLVSCCELMGGLEGECLCKVSRLELFLENAFF